MFQLFELFVKLIKDDFSQFYMAEFYVNNWFHVKSQYQKISYIFTLCRFHLVDSFFRPFDSITTISVPVNAKSIECKDDTLRMNGTFPSLTLSQIL